MLAIVFYNVVLAVHIMAVVFAFGIILAYPVIVPWLRRHHPRAMPALHTLQKRMVRTVIVPGMVVVLVAGIYLASDADAWSETWVTIPLLILLILGGMGGMFFTPTERRLGELAQRDLDAEGQKLSAEYDAVLARWQQVANIAALLVLVAIFFMTAKP
jgi:uncharacterized membrane protein